MTGTLHEEFSHLWYYLTKFFLEWENFQIKVLEKIKTQFIFNNVNPKILPLWDNVQKYGRARETAHTVAHARCMLDK